MRFPQRFPYTSINNINLDWIIKKVKEALRTANEAADNVSGAIEAAAEAEASAAAAQTAAQAAQTAAEGVVDTAAEALSTAQAAQTTAEGIASTANTALSTAQAAQTTAEDAQETAEGVESIARAAQTTANTANTTAQAAQTAAQAAQTTADSKCEIHDNAITTLTTWSSQKIRNEIDSATPSGLVSYAEAQSLTDAQQEQARENIGANWDLLWENASPGSNFAAQTISVNYSDYDLVAIESLAEVGNAVIPYSIYIPSGLCYLSTDRTWQNGGGIYQRFFTFTNNTIEWQVGRILRFQTSSTAANVVTYATGDSYQVPRRIFGLKVM